MHARDQNMQPGEECPVPYEDSTERNQRNEFLNARGELDMDSINARIQELLEAQKVLEDRDPSQELATAMMLDRADEVSRIVSKHPQVFSSWNDLFALALNGKPKILKLALENGADVNTLSKDGIPPLVATCRTKATTSPAIYKLLISHGVDLHADDGYFSPLQKAICNEDIPFLRALISAGVDIKSSESPRGPCLFFALHMCSILSFYELVEQGADVSCTHRGFSLLHYLCLHAEIPNGPEIVEFLAGKGIGLESRDSRGYTPFLLAVSMGRLDIMQSLVSAGANVRAEDSFGGNAFWVLVNSAVGIHHPECIAYLSELGISMHDKVGKFESPATRLSKFIECVPGSSVYSDMETECRRCGLLEEGGDGSGDADPLDAEL